MGLASNCVMKYRKQQRNHWISKALVASAAAFGLALAAPGCAVRGRGAVYVSDRSPPAPRYIDAPYRPGYVYIQGHWENYGSGWAWRDGYYARERPGYVYIQGRWYDNGDRWRWRDGRWDRRMRPRHVNDYRPR
jgi:hypothetical protein